MHEAAARLQLTDSMPLSGSEVEGHRAPVLFAVQRVIHLFLLANVRCLGTDTHLINHKSALGVTYPVLTHQRCNTKV